MAKNAQGAGAPSSETRPLYGMQHMAVIMRERATGDTVAAAALEPANPGSTIAIGTTPLIADRNAFVSQLLNGC